MGNVVGKQQTFCSQNSRRRLYLFVGIVYARLSGTPTCLGPEKKKGLKKRRYVEKYDCGQNLSQTIRGGCSVVFPGRMTIGQGYEESMVFSMQFIN